MRSNLRTILTFFVGWPLSSIAIFFLVRSFISQIGNIKLELLHLNWIFILIGISFFMVYYYLRSYSWYLLLKYHQHDLEVYESLFQWSFAQLKRYIPGNIWGLVGVSVHFTKKNVTKQNLASSFITESQLVLLAGSFISLFAVPLILQVIPHGGWMGVLEQGGIWVIACITAVYIFSKKIHSFLKLPRFMAYLLPNVSSHQLATLWSLMAASFVFYGLGTYFAISAITYLDPTRLWVYVGYFTFSLLVGFLSFITPTGLGVREGIMALGLAAVMPSGLASFVVLFARVMLVVGELISLGVFYLCNKLQNGKFSVVLLWLKNHPHDVLLAAGYIVFVYYFSFISFLRFENYYAGRFDLGNMEQTVWNTLRGNIFEFTNPNGISLVSRLAFHADFLLILLTPFYALWQDPRTLLLTQVIVTGGGAFFVFAIGRFLKLNKSLCLVFSFLYLFNPSLQRSVIYDFHAVTLATTFLLGAFYAILRKKYWIFGLFAFLAGISKEQIWAIIALMGVAIVVFQRKYKIGIATLIVSATLFYLFIWVIIPSFSGTQHFALSYYSVGEENSSPTTLIRLFLSSPLKIIELITDPARLDYLNALFAPLGYLPLLGPLLLVFAAPDLAINLLSSKSQLYQIYYQYTAAITPFLFIGSLYGVRWLLTRFKFITVGHLILYLVIMGIYGAYRYSPLPGAKSPNLDMITRPMPNRAQVDKVLAAIPSKYSVSTSNSLGSHVARRKYVFTFPYGWDKADYVIFMMTESNAYPSLQTHKKQIDNLTTNPNYVKYYDDGVIVAFRKIGISQ